MVVEVAVIEAKCNLLGEVSSVGEEAAWDGRESGDIYQQDRQHVKITSEKCVRHF